MDHRGPDVDRRIRSAALATLRAGGYRSLTMEGVATAAGVAKTSVYRRWPTKSALVGSVLTDLVTGPADDRDRPELMELGRRVAAVVADPPMAQAVLGVLLDANDDEVSALRGALLSRRPHRHPPGRADVAADAVAGAVLLRALVMRLPVDESYLRGLVEVIGAEHGVNSEEQS